MSTESNGAVQPGTPSSGEAPDITFVGGKAIEQTESMDSDTPADELAAAKAAVRKAIQEAGESSAKEAKEAGDNDPFRPPGAKRSKDPERGPDGKFLPQGEDKPEKAAPKEEEEALDLDKASVKQLLRQREKVANMKREAKDDISKERQALQAEYSKLQQQHQWLQQQAQEVHRAREHMAQLKKNPAQAVREAGWDPEQFILDLANDGTPEAAAKRQQAAFQAQIDEMKAWKQEQQNAAQRAQEQAYHAQIAQHRHGIVQNFLKMGMDEEKYPHVANFYKGREHHLVAAGDLTAEEYRKLSGKEGGIDQILDYLEDELADRTKSWYSKGKTSRQVSEDAPVKTSNKGKGKSLSPDFSGERRSLSASKLADLDGDERKEAARQAVKVALAASAKDD